MEKLQKALDRARQERDKHPQESSPRRPEREPRRAAAPQGTDAAWDALPMLELDRDLMERNRVMTFAPQRSSTTFDILRTKIFLMMRQNGWKRLAVTSPDMGCGKTTVSCNLAGGFRRQTDMRAMLLDLDLRRPGVGRTLGCQPRHDITDVLRGEVAPEDQLQRISDNVAVSLSSSPISDPAQLMLSNSAGRSLDQMQRTYAPDIMIFDIPPMLVTDDTRAILKNADCAIIVARSEQTRMSRLDMCEREVGEHTNVVGIVLNDCRNLSESDDSYYANYA